MQERQNHLGQPVGYPCPDWKPPAHPPHRPLTGRYCRLEPLDPDRHAADLYEAYSRDNEGKNWTYLSYGPFSSAEEYTDWVRAQSGARDPLFYAIVDLATGGAVGVASYLRIDPTSGSIEVGHIHFSPLLQGTTAATEAIFLMMKHAFELGYRRCEWKCDALNAGSRAAAKRFGFTFEGVFRQATIYKGRNRDTAWYAVTDGDWASLDETFTRWLDPANFDEDGKQRARLATRKSPSPSSAKAGFNALYHVQVPVMDIEASVRWYVDRLGFRELPGRSERHAFLSVRDDLMLMMWKTLDDSTANFTVDGETFPVLIYRTYDVHGLHDQLRDEGAEITFFKDEGFGWVLKFIDPNGNMLGAIQDK